jgi:hypothetical protein
LPGDESGLLVRDYKGKADRLATRIDPGVGSLVTELRAHERQAAEELEQWKTHHEESAGVGSEPWHAAPQMGDRASADSLRWNLDLALD